MSNWTDILKDIAIGRGFVFKPSNHRGKGIRFEDLVAKKQEFMECIEAAFSESRINIPKYMMQSENPLGKETLNQLSSYYQNTGNARNSNDANDAKKIEGFIRAIYHEKPEYLALVEQVKIKEVKIKEEKKVTPRIAAVKNFRRQKNSVVSNPLSPDLIGSNVEEMPYHFSGIGAESMHRLHAYPAEFFDLYFPTNFRIGDNFQKYLQEKDPNRNFATSPINGRDIFFAVHNYKENYERYQDVFEGRDFQNLVKELKDNRITKKFSHIDNPEHRNILALFAKRSAEGHDVREKLDQLDGLLTTGDFNESRSTAGKKAIAASRMEQLIDYNVLVQGATIDTLLRQKYRETNLGERLQHNVPHLHKLLTIGVEIGYIQKDITIGQQRGQVRELIGFFCENRDRPQAGSKNHNNLCNYLDNVRALHQNIEQAKTRMLDQNAGETKAASYLFEGMQNMLTSPVADYVELYRTMRNLGDSAAVKQRYDVLAKAAGASFSADQGHLPAFMVDPASPSRQQEHPELSSISHAQGNTVAKTDRALKEKGSHSILRVNFKTGDGKSHIGKLLKKLKHEQGIELKESEVLFVTNVAPDIDPDNGQIDINNIGDKNPKNYKDLIEKGDFKIVIFDEYESYTKKQQADIKSINFDAANVMQVRMSATPNPFIEESRLKRKADKITAYQPFYDYSEKSKLGKKASYIESSIDNVADDLSVYLKRSSAIKANLEQSKFTQYEENEDLVLPERRTFLFHDQTNNREGLFSSLKQANSALQYVVYIDDAGTKMVHEFGNKPGDKAVDIALEDFLKIEGNEGKVRSATFICLYDISKEKKQEQGVDYDIFSRGCDERVVSVAQQESVDRLDINGWVQLVGRNREVETAEEMQKSKLRVIVPDVAGLKVLVANTAKFDKQAEQFADYQTYLTDKLVKNRQEFISILKESNIYTNDSRLSNFYDLLPQGLGVSKQLMHPSPKQKADHVRKLFKEELGNNIELLECLSNEHSNKKGNHMPGFMRLLGAESRDDLHHDDLYSLAFESLTKLIYYHTELAGLAKAKARPEAEEISPYKSEAAESEVATVRRYFDVIPRADYVDSLDLESALNYLEGAEGRSRSLMIANLGNTLTEEARGTLDSILAPEKRENIVRLHKILNGLPQEYHQNSPALADYIAILQDIINPRDGNPLDATELFTKLAMQYKPKQFFENIDHLLSTRTLDDLERLGAGTNSYLGKAEIWEEDAINGALESYGQQSPIEELFVTQCSRNVTKHTQKLVSAQNISNLIGVFNARNLGTAPALVKGENNISIAIDHIDQFVVAKITLKHADHHRIDLGQNSHYFLGLNNLTPAQIADTLFNACENMVTEYLAADTPSPAIQKQLKGYIANFMKVAEEQGLGQYNAQLRGLLSQLGATQQVEDPAEKTASELAGLIDIFREGRVADALSISEGGDVTFNLVDIEPDVASALNGALGNGDADKLTIPLSNLAPDDASSIPPNETLIKEALLEGCVLLVNEYCLEDTTPERRGNIQGQISAFRKQVGAGYEQNLEELADRMRAANAQIAAKAEEAQQALAEAQDNAARLEAENLPLREAAEKAAEELTILSLNFDAQNDELSRKTEALRVLRAEHDNLKESDVQAKADLAQKISEQESYIKDLEQRNKNLATEVESLRKDKINLQAQVDANDQQQQQMQEEIRVMRSDLESEIEFLKQKALETELEHAVEMEANAEAAREAQQVLAEAQEKAARLEAENGPLIAAAEQAAQELIGLRLTLDKEGESLRQKTQELEALRKSHNALEQKYADDIESGAAEILESSQKMAKSEEEVLGFVRKNEELIAQLKVAGDRNAELERQIAENALIQENLGDQIYQMEEALNDKDAMMKEAEERANARIEELQINHSKEKEILNQQAQEAQYALDQKLQEQKDRADDLERRNSDLDQDVLRVQNASSLLQGQIRDLEEIHRNDEAAVLRLNQELRALEASASASKGTQGQAIAGLESKVSEQGQEILNLKTRIAEKDIILAQQTEEIAAAKAQNELLVNENISLQSQLQEAREAQSAANRSVEQLQIEARALEASHQLAITQLNAEHEIKLEEKQRANDDLVRENGQYKDKEEKSKEDIARLEEEISKANSVISEKSKELENSRIEIANVQEQQLRGKALTEVELSSLRKDIELYEKKKEEYEVMKEEGVKVNALLNEKLTTLQAQFEQARRDHEQAIADLTEAHQVREAELEGHLDDARQENALLQEEQKKLVAISNELIEGKDQDIAQLMGQLEVQQRELDQYLNVDGPKDTQNIAELRVKIEQDKEIIEELKIDLEKLQEENIGLQNSLVVQKETLTKQLETEAARHQQVEENLGEQLRAANAGLVAAQEKINELESSGVESGAELEEAQIKLADQEAQIAQLDSDIAADAERYRVNLEDLQNQYASEIDNIKAEHAVVVESLQQQLDASVEEVRKLTEENLALALVKESLIVDNKKLASEHAQEIEQKDAKIAAIQQSLDGNALLLEELERELLEAQKTGVSQAEEIDQLLQDIAALQTTKSADLLAIAALERDKVELQAENNRLQDKLAEQDQAFALEKANTLEAHKQQVERLEEEILVKGNELEQAELSRSVIADELEELRATNESNQVKTQEEIESLKVKEADLTAKLEEANRLKTEAGEEVLASKKELTEALAQHRKDLQAKDAQRVEAVENITAAYKVQLDKLQERLKEANAETDQARENSIELQSALDHAGLAQNILAEEVKSLQDALKAKEADVQRLLDAQKKDKQDAKVAVRDAGAAQDTKVTNLERDLKAAQAEKKAIGKEVGRRQKELDEKDKEILKLRQELVTANAAVDFARNSLIAEKRESQNLRDQLAEEKQRHQDEIDRQDEEFEAQIASIEESYNNEASNLHSTIETLEQQVADLNVVLNDVEQSATYMAEFRDQEIQRNEEGEVKFTKLQEQKKKVQGKLTEANLEIKQLKKALTKTREAYIQEREDLVAEHNAAVDDLKNQLKVSQSELEAAYAETLAALKEAENARLLNEVLEAKIDEVEADILLQREEYALEIADKEIALEESQAQLAALREAQVLQDEQLKGMRRSTAKEKEAYDAQLAANTELELQIARYADDNLYLENELTELIRSEVELKAQNEELNTILEGQQDHIEELKTKLIKAKTKVNQAKALQQETAEVALEQDQANVEEVNRLKAEIAKQQESMSEVLAKHEEKLDGLKRALKKANEGRAQDRLHFDSVVKRERAEHKLTEEHLERENIRAREEFDAARVELSQTLQAAQDKISEVEVTANLREQGYQKDIEVLEDSLEKSKREYDRVIEKNSALMAEQNDILEKQAVLEQRAARLEENLAEQQYRFKALEEERDKLAEDVRQNAGLQDILSKKNIEIRKLKTSIEAVTRDKADYAAEADRLAGKNQILNERIANTAQRMATLEDEKASLLEQVSSAQNLAEQERLARAQIEEKYRDQEAVVNSLREQLTLLEEQNSDLGLAQAQDHHDLEDAREGIKALAAGTQEVEAEYLSKVNQLAEAENDLINITDRFDVLNKEFDTLQEAMTTQRKEYEATIKNLESKHRSAIEQMQVALNAEEAKLRAAGKTKEEQDLELQSLRDDIDSLKVTHEQKLTSLSAKHQETLTDLMQDLAAEKERSAELEGYNQELSAELNEQKNRVAELEELREKHDKFVAVEQAFAEQIAAFKAANPGVAADGVDQDPDLQTVLAALEQDHAQAIGDLTASLKVMKQESNQMIQAHQREMHQAQQEQARLNALLDRAKDESTLGLLSAVEGEAKYADQEDLIAQLRAELIAQNESVRESKEGDAKYADQEDLIARLEAKLLARGEDILELNSIITDVSNERDEFERELEAYKEIEKERDRLSELVESQTLEITELRAQHERDVAEREEESMTQAAELYDLEANSAELQNQIAEQGLVVETQQGQIEDIEYSLGKALEEARESAEREAVAKQELADARARHGVAMQKERSNHQADIIIRGQKLGTTLASLESERAKNSELEAALQQEKEKVEALELQHNERVVRIGQRYAGLNQQLKSDLAAAQGEVDELEDAVELQVKALRDLTATRIASKKDLDELKTQLAEIELAQEAAVQNSSDLEAALNRLISTHANEIQALEEKHANEVVALRQELDEARSQAVTLRNENTVLRQEKDNLILEHESALETMGLEHDLKKEELKRQYENEKSQHDAAILALQQEIDKLKDKNDEIGVVALEEQAEFDKEIDALKLQIQDERSRQATLENHFKSQFAQEQSNFKQYVARLNDQHQVALEEKDAEISDLEDQLQSQQSRFAVEVQALTKSHEEANEQHRDELAAVSQQRDDLVTRVRALEAQAQAHAGSSMPAMTSALGGGMAGFRGRPTGPSRRDSVFMNSSGNDMNPGSSSAVDYSYLTERMEALRLQAETERQKIAADRDVALSKNVSDSQIARAGVDVEEAKSQADASRLAAEERIAANRTAAEERMATAKLASEEKIAADQLLIQQAELRAQQLRSQDNAADRGLEQMRIQSSEKVELAKVEQQRQQALAARQDAIDSQARDQSHQLAMQQNIAAENSRQDTIRAAEQARQDTAIAAERTHQLGLQTAQVNEHKRQEQEKKAQDQDARDRAEQAADRDSVNAFMTSLASANKTMRAEVAKLLDVASLDEATLRKLYAVKPIVGNPDGELNFESINGFKSLARARAFRDVDPNNFVELRDGDLDLNNPNQDTWDRVERGNREFSRALTAVQQRATDALADVNAIDVKGEARQALYEKGVNIDNNPKAFTKALKDMPAFDPAIKDAISDSLDDIDFSSLSRKDAREVIKNVADVTTKLGGEHNFVDFVIRNYESLGENLIGQSQNVNLIIKHAKEGEDLIELLSHVKDIGIKEDILGNPKAADLIVQADPKGAVLRKYLLKSGIDEGVARDLVAAYSEDEDIRNRIEKRAHKDENFADKLEEYGFEFKDEPSKAKPSDTPAANHSVPKSTPAFKAEPVTSVTKSVVKGGLIAGIAGIVAAMIIFPLAGAAIGCVAFAASCGYDKMTNDSIRTNNAVNYRESEASAFQETQDLLIANGADKGKPRVEGHHVQREKEKAANKTDGLSHIPFN